MKKFKIFFKDFYISFCNSMRLKTISLLMFQNLFNFIMRLKNYHHHKIRNGNTNTLINALKKKRIAFRCYCFVFLTPQNRKCVKKWVCKICHYVFHSKFKFAILIEFNCLNLYFASHCQMGYYIVVKSSRHVNFFVFVKNESFAFFHNWIP